jgi:hypothetical protein
VWVRFSHHAKNQLRLYGGTGEEAETIVEKQSGKGLDHRGNPLYLGFVDGRLTVVVVAADDPSYVITVFPKERR